MTDAHAAEVAAGLAVAEGALIAGPLEKRSDWLRAWNSRFVILTTEQLAWHPGLAAGGEAGASALGAGGSPGSWRCIVLGSGVTVGAAADGAFTLQSSDARETLMFRGITAAETEGWRAQLDGLVGALHAEAKTARLHVREMATMFDANRGFAEQPHIGSRNLRQRGIAKTYYTCRLLGQKAEAVLALTRLPPPACEWGAEQAAAFGEVLDGLSHAAHPFLMPTLAAQLLGSQQRAAVYRRFVPAGSLKDALHNSAPRAPYSHKYGAAGAQGPLPAAKVALYGRQVLEGLRFLRACGLPCSHAHAGNVFIDKLEGGAVACRISEYELSLLGASPFGVLLAIPRPAPGARAFSVGRDVLAFGHLLYEMLTSSQLTERELTRWAQIIDTGAPMPGPGAAWAILLRLFLPAPTAAKAPTLVELLADPFFSVDLSHAAHEAPAEPPRWEGATSSLLKAARRLNAPDPLTIESPAADEPPAASEGGGAAALAGGLERLSVGSREVAEAPKPKRASGKKKSKRASGDSVADADEAGPPTPSVPID